LTEMSNLLSENTCDRNVTWYDFHT
jgi:hypothetical protein